MSSRLSFAAAPFSYLRPVFPALAALSMLLSGCVSTKYKLARKNTPPPVPLNLVTVQPPVEATLNTVIVYQGPGSWKRAAFWDEYVVTLHNQGEQLLTITSATLADFADVRRAPGDDPWALEKASKTLEQQYHDADVAFVRTAGPAVVVAGTGVGLVAAAGAGSIAGGVVAGAVMTGAVITLPAYYLTTWYINSSNKAAVVTEFTRRRLALPLTLAPGETRTGSLFFPMVPNPRSLNVQWANGASAGETLCSLVALQGLHVNAPVPAVASPRAKRLPPVDMFPNPIPASLLSHP